MVSIINSKQHGLAEGLYVSDDHRAWVDIETGTVNWNGNEFSLTGHIPSVIFKIDDTGILIGTDQGIFSMNEAGQLIQNHKIIGHDSEQFRLNDGCLLSNGDLLVGSMSKHDPAQYPGKIYRISDQGKQTVFEWPCHIPNSFIELEHNHVLISDSLIQTTFCCEIIDSSLNFQPWRHFSGDICPDGGTRLPDNTVAISLWDGAAIAILDHDGNLIKEIKLPAKRPTNCKLDIKSNELIITSASMGLSSDELLNFPASGSIFSVKLS